jgi:hypothetical protein
VRSIRSKTRFQRKRERCIRSTSRWQREKYSIGEREREIPIPRHISSFLNSSDTSLGRLGGDGMREDRCWNPKTDERKVRVLFSFPMDIDDRQQQVFAVDYTFLTSGSAPIHPLLSIIILHLCISLLSFSTNLADVHRMSPSSSSFLCRCCCRCCCCCL